MDMATYTQHYGLHQWVPEDDFLRTDFNTDFQKIDTALNTVEETLRGELNGDVTRLENALDTLEKEVNSTHSGDVQRLESALSTAQSTLRGEFNTSIQQVNTTLESVQTLAEGRANIVFGTYTGDGAETRSVSLGFAPKWIMLFAASGETSNGYGGLAAVNYPIRSTSRGIHLQITGSFIRITSDAINGPLTNLSGQVYYYLAAR